MHDIEINQQFRRTAFDLWVFAAFGLLHFGASEGLDGKYHFVGAYWVCCWQIIYILDLN